MSSTAIHEPDTNIILPEERRTNVRFRLRFNGRKLTKDTVETLYGSLREFIHSKSGVKKPHLAWAKNDDAGVVEFATVEDASIAGRVLTDRWREMGVIPMDGEPPFLVEQRVVSWSVKSTLMPPRG